MKSPSSFFRTEHFWELFGHLFFLGFILFCALYYKERLLDCDAAYYTFHLMNYEEVFIKHDRWINYITQFPGLIAVRQGASLQTAMMIYSATFGLLFYLFYLIIVYGCNNRAGGIFLILALVLAMRYKHYAGHTEITVAIAEAALFFSVITGRISKKGSYRMLYWASIPILLFLMTITHPVIVIPLLLIMGFEVIVREEWGNKKWWWITGITIAMFFFKYLWVQGDAYESDKMGKLLYFNKILFHPGDYYVFDIVGRYLWKEYIPVLLVFFGLLTWFIREKKHLTALYLFACTLFLFALNLVVHEYLKVDVYVMIDGYLGMLGLIWAVPIYYFMREKTFFHRQWWIVPLLVVISSGMILSKASFYQQRLDHYRRIIDEHKPQRKLIVKMEDFNWNVMWYPYESQLESLMLSCLEGDCATIYVNHAYRPLEELTEGDKVFHSFQRTAPQEMLNDKYYRLPEQAYRVIEDVPWETED